MLGQYTIASFFQTLYAAPVSNCASQDVFGYTDQFGVLFFSPMQAVNRVQALHNVCLEMLLQEAHVTVKWRKVI
jgi:hypothetical protein